MYRSRAKITQKTPFFSSSKSIGIIEN